MNEPGEIELLTERLRYLNVTHRHDWIIETAKQLLALDATSYIAYTSLASAYNNTRRYEELRQCCENALTLWPDRPHLYYLLHLYFLFKGGSYYIVARDQLRRAIELDPLNAQYYRELAEVYLINWEPEKAKEYLETALRFEPENAEYLSRYALALLRCKAEERAKTIVMQALQSTPDDYHVLNTAGLIFLHSGDLDQAEQLFREALYRLPTYTYFQKQIEICLREKKDREFRISQNKEYTPLYLRQTGTKRFFDEDSDRARVNSNP